MSKQEKTGIIFVLVSAALWGIFPVLINRGTQTIPPITFAAITTLLAALGCFLYALFRGKLGELRNNKTYFYLLMITLCIVIIPYVLFYVGASKTTGLNSTMLLLSELIFTLIFTHFIGEKTTSTKLFGGLGIFFGALLILFNGQLKFNIGDLLIIASTSVEPIGNLYAKKALNLISPATILFVRFLFGGLFILLLSLLFEPQANFVMLISNNWFIILFTGLILLGISKILCYEALKRLDISKMISLLMTFPLFSLVVLISIYKEIPSVYQWLGIALMAVGVYFSIRRNSTDPLLTSYAP